jgi:hypothetical protein
MSHERSHEARHEAKDVSKDKKKGKKAIIAAVATGVLVLGVGGALISGNLNRSNSESSSSPSTSQQANETETTPSGPQIPEKAESYGGIKQGLEGEALTKAFEIPAGLSNEEFAKAFADRKSAWAMYGSTPELAKQYWGEAAGGNETAANISNISKSNAAAIRSALFSDTVTDRPGNPRKTRIDTFVSYMTAVNEYTLGVWARTIPYPEVYPENKEPYTRITSVVSLEDESQYAADSTRGIKLICIEKENVDKNNSRELNAGILGTEGKETTYIINTTTINGVEKITGLVER